MRQKAVKILSEIILKMKMFSGTCLWWKKDSEHFWFNPKSGKKSKGRSNELQKKINIFSDLSHCSCSHSLGVFSVSIWRCAEAALKYLPHRFLPPHRYDGGEWSSFCVVAGQLKLHQRQVKNYAEVFLLNWPFKLALIQKVFGPVRRLQDVFPPSDDWRLWVDTHQL